MAIEQIVLLDNLDYGAIVEEKTKELEEGMDFFSPTGPQDLAARDAMLSRALRPEPLPFAIAGEYPIVLSPESAHLSHCLRVGGEVVAHANLWPRRLFSSQTGETLTVGLVGNVATDEKWRGKGYMRLLLDELTRKARADGLEALILWSDLQQFYQNLGFASLGRELRFFFKLKALHKKLAIPCRFDLIDAKSLTDADLEALLALRHPTTATLDRSVAEFRKLLTIPATGLFIACNGSSIDAYCVVGKGYDMMGVVHEWGAREPLDLLSGVLCVGERLELEELILLGPGSMDSTWRAAVSKVARKVEEHPMALAKRLGAASYHPFFEDAFIWGLDSI